jgi:GNAT superfamily N-acetyltransferase
MQPAEIQDINENLAPELLQLWNSVYPVSVCYTNVEDFRKYLQNLQDPEHLVLKSQTGKVMAWGFTFHRENERWFGLLVQNEFQGTGLGSLLLEKMMESETQLSGWITDHDRSLKQTGEVYPSPMGFYLKHGFIAHPGIRLETDSLSALKMVWTRKSETQNSRPHN